MAISLWRFPDDEMSNTRPPWRFHDDKEDDHFGNFLMTKCQIHLYLGDSPMTIRPNTLLPWRFPDDKKDDVPFTLYNYRERALRYITRKYCCGPAVVPVFVTHLDFYLFLFCDYLFGGSGLVLVFKVRRGVLVPLQKVVILRGGVLVHQESF